MNPSGMIEPPKSLLKALNVPKKLLMGPGPSNCSPRVLHSLSQQVIGHLHQECLQIMDEIKEGLQYVFQTRNRLTLAVSATGHAGMEAVMCNLIEPGDIVLVTVNGIWGERAADMAARYGAVVHKVEKPLGESFSISEIEQALRKFHPSLLFVVQGESSTGVFQRCCQLGPLCHKYGCLLAVDTVASLGGVQFYADRWEVDVVYTGSQKVLGAPPGLAPISFSPRAEAKIRGRRTPVKVFYLDMTLLGDYWGCFGNPRIYHHTVPVTLLYGLREGLAQLAEESLQKCWERHKNCSIQLHEGITKLGLDFFVRDATSRLPTVTAISLPPHIDGRAVSRYAMERYGLEIAGGLGPTVGKIMRIGLMGYNATPENVSVTLAVLKEALAHATASRL
ncbi:alanine--glyoxylate aminotransferase-like [Schistocerca americana]|uniref:alanine--glyoxylate aminotransferase-like n=1 Tax=Schistocerca americana TaxID=7009 RepID=UPI001F4FE559|nr:alanine--glyoxylate aminotransferase-like [Schistocerca americana]